MNGLVRRDLMVLRARRLPMKALVFAIFSIAFSGIMGFAGSGLLSVIAPLAALAAALSLFATDDADAWHVFLCISPVPLERVVMSRYIVVLGAVVAASMFELALNLAIFAAFREQELIWYLVFTLAGFLGACASAIISMPLCYWAGASGSNIAQLAPLVVLGGLAAGVRVIDVRQVTSFLLTLSVFHYVLAVLAVLVVGLFVSAASSVFLYRRRISERRIAK